MDEKKEEFVLPLFNLSRLLRSFGFFVGLTGFFQRINQFFKGLTGFFAPKLENRAESNVTHDTQHNDNKHNDNKHNDNKHNDNKHNNT